MTNMTFKSVYEKQIKIMHVADHASSTSKVTHFQNGDNNKTKDHVFLDPNTTIMESL